MNTAHPIQITLQTPTNQQRNMKIVRLFLKSYDLPKHKTYINQKDKSVTMTFSNSFEIMFHGDNITTYFASQFYPFLSMTATLLMLQTVLSKTVLYSKIDQQKMVTSTTIFDTY